MSLVRFYLLLEMKILEENAGALTNFEVLDFLRAKGASKDPSRVLAKVAMSEYKVYDYLVKTPAGSQTRESVKEYFTAIKQHDLSEAEVLNVLNIRPASEVEIYHIIEDCEERFPDEEVFCSQFICIFFFFFSLQNQTFLFFPTHFFFFNG